MEESRDNLDAKVGLAPRLYMVAPSNGDAQWCNAVGPDGIRISTSEEQRSDDGGILRFLGRSMQTRAGPVAPSSIGVSTTIKAVNYALDRSLPKKRPLFPI